ncbi:MAG: hydantoinase/oxoprolinase family protein, partial [Paracoccaceae bacterium]
MTKLQVAVDVGGTFIDVVVSDMETNETRIAKILHRRGGQGEDILHAVRALIEPSGGKLADLDTVVIGTTVVTNALLEHDLAKAALITTAGFRDVVEIARMSRASSFDVHKRRPAPLVPRALRLEAEERILSDGSVHIELNEEALREQIQVLKTEKVEAVAVSLLFSFLNASHEQRIAELLRESLNVPVSISSQVLPVFREYERTSTTIVNAATTPVMDKFIKGLDPIMFDGGPKIYIMGSDGGCMTMSEAQRTPVRCTLSGPAGGVIGALNLVRQLALGDALTFDVGGTSTDVALLHRGKSPLTDERRIGGYPVALPSVDVETVGSGGGSIAYIDRTGLLKVGPRSASSFPGP